MTSYAFFEGKVPAGCVWNFDPWLFHHQDHLSLQSQEGWHTFYLLKEKRNTVEALMHVHLNNGIASSPLRASFGSVQFSKTVEPMALQRFLEQVITRFNIAGAEKFVVKNPPDIYTENASLLNVVLFNLGFQVAHAEVGAVIPVGGKPLLKILDAWEKRKLRLSEQADVKFEQAALDSLSSIYNFILACRKQKNYKLSMTFEALHQVVKIFPGRFYLFKVMANEKLSAASITIDVGNKVLYTFYTAHDPQYNSLSPVVKLIQGIYNFCTVHGYKMLDLGTSSVNGMINFSLLHFKLRLGAIATQKLTFEKLLKA